MTANMAMGEFSAGATAFDNKGWTFPT